jgi:RNA polymerase sigma factor (sigma-70 family)
MRQILISEGRKRMSVKRGGGNQPLSLDTNIEAELQTSLPEFSLEDLEALNIILEKLEKHENHHWMATLVDLHFFAGLTFEQIAKMMDCSKGKVMRDWTFTKAWLREEMEK